MFSRYAIIKREPVIYIFRKTKVHSQSKSLFTLQPDSRLYINRSWVGQHPFPFFLTADSHSKIICHENFSFYEGGHIGLSRGAILELGSGYANRNINISCRKRIAIGKNVAIGPNVVIRDSDDHKIDTNHDSEISAEVIIGDDVWIGSNAIILKGVTVGNGCVIAAGSVVTRSIPAGSLAAGVTARVIKTGISWE